MNFSHFSIRAKIGFGFGTLVVIIVLLGLAALWQLQAVNASTAQIPADNLANVQLAATMRDLLGDIRDLLEPDLDPGQLLELFYVLLREVPARGKLIVDLDALALALLPVEAGLGAGMLGDSRSGERGRGGLKQAAAGNHVCFLW